MSKHMDPEQVRRLTLAGGSAATIAEELGCTQRTVVRIRARLGLSKPGNNQPPAPDQLDQAHRLLEDGTGYRETARISGVGVSTLHRRFPGMGMTPADCGHKTQTNRQLQRLVASGLL